MNLIHNYIHRSTSKRMAAFAAEGCFGIKQKHGNKHVNTLLAKYTVEADRMREIAKELYTEKNKYSSDNRAS